MAFTARLNNLRIAPRKVRIVADIIRGKKTEEARAILRFTIKKSALPLLKLLDSAIASAKNNFQAKAENLYISKITVDEGRKLKRWMPKARGSATPIQKKTSHITLFLEEIKKGDKKKERKAHKAVVLKREDGKEVKKEISFKPERERKKPKAAFNAPKPKTEKSFKRLFMRKTV